MFHNNLPRLSVDVDLTYIPIEDRDASILNINKGLFKIAQEIEKLNLKANIIGNDIQKKISCYNHNTQIIIEPNYILRGTVFLPERKEICISLKKQFGNISITTLSYEEVYAGKLCASLDRGHPRDIFDVYYLYKNGEITDGMVKCFIVYSLCHNSKSIYGLLNGKTRHQNNEIKKLLETSFYGMTNISFTMEDYMRTQIKLREDLKKKILSYKNFINNFYNLTVDIKNAPFKNFYDLPGVKWRMLNLEKLYLSNNDEFIRQRENVFSLFDSKAMDPFER